MPLDNVTGLAVLASTQLGRVWSKATWKSGERLRILVVGYTGKRNTGADLRAAAMVQQFRRVLGDENIEVGVMSLNTAASQVYFPPPNRQVPYTTIFFKPTLEAVSHHHMVVLAEGSTLKSQFGNGLTYFFCEAAGVAQVQGKPCIAYGSEVGRMDPFVEWTAKRLCRDTYFIARTEPSLELLHQLGLDGIRGTDTAWPTEPAPAAWAEQELVNQAGWDRHKPLLGVAVINPFHWPLKPSVARTLKALWTGNWEDHYEKWFFFAASTARRQSYRAYLTHLARAVDDFAEKHHMQVVLFGMEALDRPACADLREILRSPAAVFESQRYDGYQMTALLRQLQLLVTSRYHAKVLSMAGGVPAVAVSMDERLHNLCVEAGQLDYYLTTDDPNLGDKLYVALERLLTQRESVHAANLAAVPGYLREMARMGQFLRRFVAERFPGVTLAAEPEDWRGYLPPLSPTLERLVAHVPEGSPVEVRQEVA